MKGQDPLRKEIADKVNKVLNAEINNSMTTVRRGFVKLMRPNNYRRCALFEGVPNSASIRNGGTIGRHNKLVSFKNWGGRGVTVQFGKSRVWGIYDQKSHLGKKFWYKFERGSLAELNSAMNDKKEEIGRLVDSVVDEVCGLVGVERVGVFSWLRAETGVKNDDFLDNLPEDLVIHDSVFRKVYKDEVEFLTGKGDDPLVYAKNYISNRALEDVAPGVASALERVAEQQRRIGDEALVPLTEQIKLHLVVMRDIQGSLKAIRDVAVGGGVGHADSEIVVSGVGSGLLGRLKSGIRSVEDLVLYRGFIIKLGEDERLALSEWLFERFGNGGGGV